MLAMAFGMIVARVVIVPPVSDDCGNIIIRKEPFLYMHLVLQDCSGELGLKAFALGEVN